MENEYSGAQICPTVRVLLEIAEENASAMEASEDEADRLKRAITVSVFAAATIEAAATAYVLLPSLFSSGHEELTYDLVEMARGSVRAKLRIVQKHCSKYQEAKRLHGKANALFDYRDKIMHATPAWVSQKEAAALKVVPPDLTTTLTLTLIAPPQNQPGPDFERRGALTFSFDKAAVEKARDHLKTARRVVDCMTFTYGPEAEPPASDVST